MSDLEQWWASLKPDTRQRLQRDPWGPVPPDLWADVTREGVGVAGTYWPDSQPGPEGFHFRDEVSEFIEVRPHGITYRGHPALVGLLAQMLREEGVRVQYEPPMEHRGISDDAHQVIISILTWGAIGTIDAVIAKFRKRPGDADATVEGDPEPDKH
jgi:hypothetical protein